MAPTFRNRDRRPNRSSHVDHDLLEGLPVRHWRRGDVTVAPPATQENTTSQNDIWAVELPHGMPKDSHLLPQHSQDLLRAARSGRIYKRPAPLEEEEADVEAVLGDKPEKKDDDTKERGFTAKAWKQIPRHMEGPDIDYLAKRRKGLVTITARVAPPTSTLTKNTVKRIDAAGNEYVQDVIVPHGQKVEGEVISQTVVPDPSAAAVDPFAVHQVTPARSKKSSKKKSKGAAGRGRKKKAAAPTSVPASMHLEGAAPVAEGANGTVSADGVKSENETGTTPANNEDTEMGDGSMAASDDDEDGEDGDDGEDDEGSVDNQNSPSKPPRPTSPVPLATTGIKTVPSLGFGDTPMSGLEFPRPHPMIHTERVKSEGQSGSPLKNVALTTSALTSPLESPTVAAPFSEINAPAPEQDHVATAGEKEALDEEMLLETAESAPTEIPPPPPNPTAAEIVASEELLREEEEEEEMLLDIVENANNAQIGGSDAPIAAPGIPAEQAPIPLAEATTEPIPSEDLAAPVEIEQEDPALVENPEPDPVQEEQKVEEEDDDDLLDLLGGLEKSLEKPEQAPVAPKPVEVKEQEETTQPTNTETSESVGAVETEKQET
ncbi:hypothetical protein N431DRAFT_468632 [Stipitochalara longipes BDJ]|nr:hypothetical protein N431DRAFT_468632 [Stipitochalara longipes BDJ]